MAHPREPIVEAAVALLIAAGTAGSRVYNTRVEAQKKTGMPAVSVYALDDPASADASSEMEEAHALELKLICWAVPSEINDLANQVEVAMRADPYFGGLASDSTLMGTTIDPEADTRSDPPVAIAVLTYSVAYHIALDPT